MKKIKKFLLLAAAVVLLSPLGGFSADFSMRPIQLPILRKLEFFLSRIQKKQWLCLADRAFKRVGLYAWFSAAFQCDTKIIHAYRPIKASCANKKTFKVVSANMLLYPKPFLFNQTERVNEFLKMLKKEDPDFVFLQEVWDKTAIEAILAPLYAYDAAFISSLGYNFSGLLILSKYPIKKSSAVKYPISLGYNISEIIAQKGILSAEVNVNGRVITLAATHLFSAAGAQKILNREQITYLERFLSALKTPVIIGADMNNTPSSLKKALPKSIITDNCTQATAGYPYPTQKLDYIMVYSPNGKAKVSGRRIDYRPRFSDHLSLGGVVSLY